MENFAKILILTFLLSALSLDKALAVKEEEWKEYCELEESTLTLSFNSTFGPLQTLKCHNFNAFPRNLIKSEKVEKLDFGRSQARKYGFERSRLNHLNNLTDGVMRQAFENFPSLRWIYLGGCFIDKIEKGAFEGGNKLVVLNLSNNNITSLDLDIFLDVLNLERLDLSSNPLGDFQNGAQFPKMKLQWLALKNCSLKTLEPTLLDNLVDLRSLHLGNNQIVEIDNNFFTNLQNLQILRLEGNQFAGFDENICDLKHLSTFTFEKNPVFCNCDVANLIDLLRERNVYFPEEPDCSFKTPAYTQVLNQSISSTISKLCPVSENMSSKECREPSSEFMEGYCSLAKEETTGSLTFICIGFRNGLPRDLQSLWGNPSKLVMDTHRTNNLKILQDGELKKTGLSSLKELNLGRCQIQIIERGAFRGGQDIRLLELYENLLENLDAGVFSELVNLRELFLSSNPIQSFKKGSEFPDLPYLESLNLENCKLTTLEKGIFKNLKSLETLNLRQNLMKTLNFEVVRPFSLSSFCIRLEGNPWNCKAYQFQKMVMLLQGRGIHFISFQDEISKKCGGLPTVCRNIFPFKCIKDLGVTDMGCSNEDNEEDLGSSEEATNGDGTEIGIVYESHNAVIIAILTAAVSLIFVVFFAFVVGKYLRRSSNKGFYGITPVEYVARTSQNDEGEGEESELDRQEQTETIV